MKLLNKRGQSLAEYGIIIGVVIGAVFAMTPYIKTRIQGAIQVQADAYSSAAGGGVYDPDVVQDSTSDTNLAFQSATQGSVDQTSDSTSTMTW